MSETQSFRVLISKDEAGTFAAQCLEYDIFTQASSEEKVKVRFAKQMEVERIVSNEATGLDFGGISPAPECFHNIWDRAKGLDDSDSTEYRMYGT